MLLKPIHLFNVLPFIFVLSLHWMILDCLRVCGIFLKVGRIKQKRGYKDQWPWNIKIYVDDSGKAKGDACLAYEDPSAAHSAGGFYNSKIAVEFAMFSDINFSNAKSSSVSNAFILFMF
jgi:hypothetical protein